MVESYMKFDHASSKESFSTNSASMGSRRFKAKSEAKEEVDDSQSDGSQIKKKLKSEKKEI